MMFTRRIRLGSRTFWSYLFDHPVLQIKINDSNPLTKKKQVKKISAQAFSKSQKEQHNPQRLTLGYILHIVHPKNAAGIARWQ